MAGRQVFKITVASINLRLCLRRLTAQPSYPVTFVLKTPGKEERRGPALLFRLREEIIKARTHPGGAAPPPPTQEASQMWLLLWVLVGGAFPPQSRWDMNIHASSLAPRGAAPPYGCLQGLHAFNATLSLFSSLIFFF